MTKLLRPFDLAKEPLRFEVEPGTYSFETQTRRSNTPTAASFATFSGTRTYGPGGKPWDSDND